MALLPTPELPPPNEDSLASARGVDLGERHIKVVVSENTVSDGSKAEWKD